MVSILKSGIPIEWRSLGFRNLGICILESGIVVEFLEFWILHYEENTQSLTGGKTQNSKG